MGGVEVISRWEKASFAAFFSWKVPEGHPAEGDNKEFVEVTDSYMSSFSVQLKFPASDGLSYQHCNNCGRRADAFRQALGLFPEVTAFAWSLAHGEAHCMACKWPYRAHHFPKKEDGSELFGLRHLYLAYTPENVLGQKPCPDEETFFPHEGVQQADAGAETGCDAGSVEEVVGSRADS